MSWSDNLSKEEKEEMYADSCTAYQSGLVSFQEFVLALSKLGYNATEIADAEKSYRPQPPEDNLS